MNLSDYGMDSITFTLLTREINEIYRINLTPAIFYGYNTIQSISEYLVESFSPLQ